jgi:curli biogenesis system outer membrane secretion channel CsgG
MFFWLFSSTTPISYSSAEAANFYEVNLTLNVRLIDMKTNELFYQGTGLVFQETYETDSANFFFQETGSLVKIAAKFASSIVNSILENF